ncbi:MAG: prenyltransferase, partial [Atribacterota bacterium]|nr:prenyltransferase [Atribacterota bacterium]
MINRFLSFIEIKTKITSIFAFLLALAYLFYIQQPINWRLTVIFFASMFIFDLTTTSINNYIDTKTNDQKLQFKRKTALLILLLLLSISTLLGLYLAILTDLVVLFLGGLCFLTGIFYTFGPIPISRLPLGEILSGL